MSNHSTTSIANSPFNNWMPLLGIYIAGGTFVCVIAIVNDLKAALQTKQWWIPSSWSSLNAASITFIAVASKLSLDLGTSMPQQIDQLSKLSTSAFMCIAFAVVAPSLGKLDSKDFLSNIISLVAFAISSIAGLCIQLKTGIIFTFRTAHIIMVVMMCILLLTCVVSSVALALTKGHYITRFDTQNQEAIKDVNLIDRNHLTTKTLKQYLERYYVLAYSCCPEFTMAQFAQGVIYTLCGLVAALAFFTILIACKTHNDKFLGPTSRNGTSKYGWSVLYVLISQATAIGVGSIVLCFRGYFPFAVQLGKANPIKFQEEETDTSEKYWLTMISDIDWVPFLPFIEYRQQKFPGYLFKYPFYMASLTVQFFCIVIDRILFDYIPISIVTCIMSVIPARCHRNEDDPVLKELKPYFMFLGTKFTQVGKMLKSVLYVCNKYLGVKERETKHLIKLLQEFQSNNFEGVFKFQIPPAKDSREAPPHSWSLSVLALTWIADALPNINHSSKDELKKSVMEGLVYVKLIENNFNNQVEFACTRDAASYMWLFPKLFPLRRHRFRCETAKGTLELIRNGARSSFEKPRTRITTFVGTSLLGASLVGAHYAYGTCEMILQDCQNIPDESSLIFDKLRRTISDILGACLINLKTYILQQCERSSSTYPIGKWREEADEIIKLFGETEKIMEILEKRQIPNISLDKMVRMDSWHLYYHHTA